jgi:hypothetical protein
MKWWLLVLCVIQLKLSAQVPMEEFLSSAWDDPAVKSFSTRDQYLQNKPYQLSPVRRLEFRTETNQLDPDRQEYQLRLSPSNPWEMKYTNRYFGAYREMLQYDRDRALKEALYARYVEIADWVYQSDVESLRREEKEITDQLVQVLEAQRFSRFFDPEDYVELKLDQVDRAVDLEKVRFELDNVKHRVAALYASAQLQRLDWTRENIITVAALEQVVDSISIYETAGGEVAYRLKRIDLASQEWHLEKSNINIGYVQARYQEFRLDQERSPWSITLGVVIPVFNPNKGDMTKRKLDMIKAQDDYDAVKQQITNDGFIAREKLKSLLERLADIRTLQENLNIDELTSHLQAMNSNNPVLGLQVKRKLVKLQVMEAQLHHQVVLTYLDFLKTTERLQQRPLINYLSPQLITLQP